MKPTNTWLVALVVLAGACTRDLSTPAPPDPTRPGTIQGTIVYAQAGLMLLQPAKDATIELVGSGVVATADAQGHFLLKPISTATGSMLIRFDSDGDKKIDHQRVFDLQDIGAGPGHDITLTQIRLGENAAIRGTVLRSDLSTLASGHAGTAVFVPEGPFTVYTGDNGAFALENLPQGLITLAFFRQGYVSSVAHVELRAGEVFSLSTVLLTPQAGTPAPARVSGFALLAGQTSHGGIAVTMTGIGMTTTDAAGRYVFPQVPRGVYSLGFQRDGYLSQVLTNVLIDEDVVEQRALTLVAGESMQPNLDGGLQPFDAGPSVDAGPPDAGPPDAGPPDAGPSDAGQSVDAGPPPVAIISPLPPFVQSNSAVMMRGDMSTGNRPLIFHWRQDAGTTVTIPNNDSPLAATPMFTAPATPQVLHFGLTVTDVNGRTSTSAELSLPVAGMPPTASIMGTPAQAQGGEIITLTGTGNDPSGSGIVSYNWVVNPSSLATATRTGGTLLDITMPATVVTPIVVMVSLTVTNGLGITSAAANTTFNLTTMTTAPWYVDAGAPQVVNGGATVTLNGIAVTPGFTGATFSYAWSPPSMLPDWQLTNPAVPVTQFVAPIVVGANRTLPFTLTATVTRSGLLPAQNVGGLNVLVQDRTPPTVVATSIDGSGFNSGYNLTIDFSEPVDPVSINSISVGVPSGAVYSGLQVTGRFVDKSRVSIAMRGNVGFGNIYVLNVNSVRDLAPVPNTMSPGQSYPFTAVNPWSAASVSTQTSTTEPRPSLVLRPTPGGAPGAMQALIAGRKDSQPWFLAAFDPGPCAASGCMLADDALMPPAGLAPQNVRGHKGFLLQGANPTAVATVQLRDYQSDAGIAFTRSGGGGWAALPAVPGQFSVNGPQLRAAYANNGLFIAMYDGTAFNLADAGQISASAADFPSDSASDPLVQAATAPGADPMLVARTSKTGQLRYFRETSPGVWASYGNQTGTPIVDVRLQPLPQYGGAAIATYLRQSGALDTTIWGDVNNGGSPYASGVSSFDTLYESNSHWIVASVNGLLLVTFQNVPGSGTTFTMPGVIRSGMPSADINNDPLCFADHPELASLNGRVVVTWQEKCASQPFKLYFRTLN